MSTEIKVPTLPESVADATIIAWHKKPGDTVSRDEVLVDVETDKVVLEVPAPHAGVLDSILEDEGAVVVAEQVLGMLSEAQAQDVSAAPDQSADAEDVSSEKGPTGPAVRKLLAENNLSASDIKGSGSNGRVSKEDVQAYIASRSEQSVSTAAPKIEATPEKLVQKKHRRLFQLSQIQWKNGPKEEYL